LATFFAGLLLLNAAAFSAPRSAAAMPLCTLDGWHNLFVGDTLGPSGLKGAQTTIEWFNDQLCAQRERFDFSWSLAWVAIVGVHDLTYDIFQGGFARCASLGMPYSCPYNNGVSYHFWWWSYGDGACGSAFNSTFRKANKGNASAGMYNYKIDYRPAAGRYSFVIDGTDQTFIPTSTPTTCWGGIRRAQWFNEMLDNGDQSGGTIANHQTYNRSKWQDSSANWHTVSWPTSTPCPVNVNPTAWKCNNTAIVGQFLDWDARAP
jgi:hypothetical protein